MPRASFYSLLAFAIATSCMVQYFGTRLLARWPAARQNRAMIGSLGLCALLLAFFRTNIVVTDCFVLMVGLFTGTLLSRQIGSMGALVTFLTVGAISDLISAHSGPTRWLTTHDPHAGGFALVQLLCISIPWNGKVLYLIGVGDLMLFAVCVSALRRFGWPEATVLGVPLAGIISAVGVGLCFGLTPAIPFLAAAVILYAYLTPSKSQTQPCRG